MAKKISSFQELTDLSVDDYLPIIDDSEIQANMNKRVTIATLDSRYKVGTLDNGDVTINGSLDVDGDASIAGYIHVLGTPASLLVDGDASLSNVYVAGNLDVLGDTSLSNSSINGDLNVSGAVTIDGLIKLSSDEGGGGNLECNQVLVTDGSNSTTILPKVIDTNDFTAQTILCQERFRASGDTSLSNVNVVGNLDVSGDTSLSNLTAGNTTFGDFTINVGHQQINLNYTNTDISGSIDLGSITVTGLPSSDPAVSGRLWNDSGTLKISSGVATSGVAS